MCLFLTIQLEPVSFLSFCTSCKFAYNKWSGPDRLGDRICFATFSWRQIGVFVDLTNLLHIIVIIQSGVWFLSGEKYLILIWIVQVKLFKIKKYFFSVKYLNIYSHYWFSPSASNVSSNPFTATSMSPKYNEASIEIMIFTIDGRVCLLFCRCSFD